MKRWCICISLMIGGICAENSLPAPYSQLKELLPFFDSYSMNNEPRWESIFSNNKIEVVIDVGSWMGNSARHFAAKIPENGKVYAVDHWLGSEEQQGDPYIPILYEQFLSNAIHAGLADKIVPIRTWSIEAARYLNLMGVKPDLVYIDASHDTESVLADLRAWYPFVKGHGILCGDDWNHGPVEKAVRIFAEEEGLIIQVPSYNFFRLIEP